MNNYIFGAGMTELSAGLHSGLSVYEIAEPTGGISSSYYNATWGRAPLHHFWQQRVYRFKIKGELGMNDIGCDVLTLR
jgi:hypothetical protein